MNIRISKREKHTDHVSENNEIDCMKSFIEIKLKEKFENLINVK